MDYTSADAEADSKAASQSAPMLPLTLNIPTSTTTTSTSRPVTIHKDDIMLLGSCAHMVCCLAFDCWKSTKVALILISLKNALTLALMGLSIDCFCRRSTALMFWETITALPSG
jgi:hypothetical protein